MTSESRTLRAVIVDDEEPARLAVRHGLEAIGGVEVVAECSNGFDAVKTVSDLLPDVVFLDVQMPKLNGFEVLELLARDIPVIFVTAFDEFALRAFDVYAVDYLLKPFSSERLSAAVERLRLRQASSSPDPRALGASARPPGAPLERVVIRDGAHVHVIPVDRIDYIEAQDDYVSFHVGGKSFLKDQTLGDLETTLDSRRFVRVHRSFLLNIERLARVELYAKDSRIAILTDGAKLPISRAGYQRLQELL